MKYPIRKYAFAFGVVLLFALPVANFQSFAWLVVSLFSDSLRPPYRWSVSTGSSAGEVVVCLPVHGSMSLVRMQLKTNEACLLRHVPREHFFNPQYHSSRSVLTCISSVGMVEKTCVEFLGTQGIETWKSSTHNAYCLTLLPSDQGMVLSATRRGGLPTEGELYFAKPVRGVLEFTRLTSDDRMDGGPFFVSSTKQLIWSRPSKVDDPDIMSANMVFTPSGPQLQQVEVVGNGYLMNHIHGTAMFITAHGKARDGELFLWDSTDNTSVKLPVIQGGSPISVCSILGSDDLVVMSMMKDNVVALDVIKRADKEMSLEHWLTIQQVGSSWKLIGPQGEIKLLDCPDAPKL